jgi:hypothetical protein
VVQKIGASQIVSPIDLASFRRCGFLISKTMNQQVQETDLSRFLDSPFENTQWVDDLPLIDFDRGATTVAADIDAVFVDAVASWNQPPACHPEESHAKAQRREVPGPSAFSASSRLCVTPDLERPRLCVPPDPERSWLDRIPMSALVASMLFGLFMFGTKHWNPDRPHSSAFFASSAFPTDTASDHSAFRTPHSAFDSRIAAIPIRDIRVGMRVPAHNPELSDADRSAAASNLALDPDPATWRKFTFDLEKESGGKVQVRLLRPSSWLVDEIVETNLSLLQQQRADRESQRSKQTKWQRLGHDLLSACATNPFEAMAACAGEVTSWFQPGVVTGDVPMSVLGFVVAGIEQEITEATEFNGFYLDEIASIQKGALCDQPIWLELPELGAVGWATLKSNEPCPPIQSGPGQLVTATFVHESADVLDLTFAKTASHSDTIPSGFSGDKSFSLQPSAASLTRAPTFKLHTSDFTLSPTANHPFWSETRHRFVAAGKMEIGEEVIGINGQVFRLTSIVPRAGPEPVYNFEVALEHVYFVSSSGLLVHNMCTPKNTGKASAKHANAPSAQPAKTAKRINGNSASSALEQIGYVVINNRTGEYLKAGITSAERGLRRRLTEQSSRLTNLTGVARNNLDAIEVFRVAGGPGARGDALASEKRFSKFLISLGNLLPGHLRPR